MKQYIKVGKKRPGRKSKPVERTKKSYKVHYKIKAIHPYPVKEFGPKQKTKLTKKAKSQIAQVKKYKRIIKNRKAVIARKYTQAINKSKHFLPAEKERARKYTLTGKAVKIAVSNIPVEKVRIGKKTKGYKIKGKGWYSEKRFKSLVKITKYNSIIKHYRELYKISQKEARELYRLLRGEYGHKARQAIY